MVFYWNPRESVYYFGLEALKGCPRNWRNLLNLKGISNAEACWKGYPIRGLRPLSDALSNTDAGYGFYRGGNGRVFK